MVRSKLLDRAFQFLAIAHKLLNLGTKISLVRRQILSRPAGSRISLFRIGWIDRLRLRVTVLPGGAGIRSITTKPTATDGRVH